MKYFILLVITLFCSEAKSQSFYGIDSTSGRLTYYNVVEFDSMGSDKLFSYSKSALSKIYKNYSRVVQNEDKDNKNITLKAIASSRFVKCGYKDYSISYNLTIRVKDSKYKLTMENFIFEGYKPLEDESAQLGCFKNQFEWENVKSFFKEYCISLNNMLKSEIDKELKSNDF